MEYSIYCHVYGAEQDTDLDQNRVKTKMLETHSVNVVMTTKVADLGVRDVVVAAPGSLLFHLRRLPNSRKHSRSGRAQVSQDDDLQSHLLDLKSPMEDWRYYVLNHWHEWLNFVTTAYWLS